MTAVPDVIKRLVERFDRNADTYRSPAYNGTQLRVEFVKPFWKALGWDADNVEGRALVYRQVVHVGVLMVGGATKAAGNLRSLVT